MPSILSKVFNIPCRNIKRPRFNLRKFLYIEGKCRENAINPFWILTTENFIQNRNELYIDRSANCLRVHQCHISHLSVAEKESHI